MSERRKIRAIVWLQGAVLLGGLLIALGTIGKILDTDFITWETLEMGMVVFSAAWTIAYRKTGWKLWQAILATGAIAIVGTYFTFR